MAVLLKVFRAARAPAKPAALVETLL